MSTVISNNKAEADAAVANGDANSHENNKITDLDKD